MNILNRLTIKHLKLNKKRTIVTIIGIILSTALMIGIGLLFSSIRDYSVKEIKSWNGSHHASIKSVTKDNINTIKNNKKVKEVIYKKEIGFSYINSEDTSYGYLKLVAADSKYFEHLKLVKGRMPENNNEIVITEQILDMGGNYKIGDKVSLEYGSRTLDGERLEKDVYYDPSEILTIEGSHEYTIVGIIERDIYEDYLVPGFQVITNDNNTDKELTVYITYKKVKDVYENTKALAKSIGKAIPGNTSPFIYPDVEYNDALLSLYGQSRYDNFNSVISGIMVIMLGIISVGCIIVIYNSFAISVMERKKQFGLFSSIGATRKQLRHTVFYEAVIVGTIGIVLGVLSGFLGIWVVLEIVNNLLKNIFEFGLRIAPYPIFIIIPLIFMTTVIILSAFLPAMRASRITPIEAIRQNDDIKIKGKKVKTNKLVTKLFGIPGELALKNIKRNKKKYRITVISLIISIVMFVSFSSFLRYGTEGVSSYLTDPDFDISVSGWISEDLEQNKKLYTALDKIKKHEQSLEYVEFIQMSSASIKKIDEKYFTDEFKELNTGMFTTDETGKETLYTYDMQYISIFALSDESYNKLKEKYNIKDNNPILINHYGMIDYSNNNRKYVEGKIFSTKNFNIDLCDTSNMYTETGIDEDNYDCNALKLNNIYMLDNVPFGFSTYTSYGINLIVNMDMYNTIKDKTNYAYEDQVEILIKSPKYDSLDKLIKTYSEDSERDVSINYTNINEVMRLQKNIILVVKILLYGFIALVTLIGVTSVFNTINTSIALRRREFAMLRSMGLTPKGFNKMLRFESIFFGLKSLLWGLPIAFLVVIWMHSTMIDMVEFSQILVPWNSIIIAVASVFVIVFLTMMYATKRIKKENILEAIREENI